MKNSNETIGDLIRRFRIYRKVNYKKTNSEKNPYNLPEFARTLDISPSALSQIERNIIKKPSSRIVEKAVELLEININDFNKSNGISVDAEFSDVINELVELINETNNK